ncbi:hypothetical protein ENSA7_48440 [Enhygromyxa salina]|uniref:Uncharacterized protein n=1 Tax=Enhygromyxa salina TaxID=215803 RepID=A0A2S9YIH0_9BACT|nr:hypothetical protein ENSA7_48440 [Enhygromyxa salina]
MPGHVQAGRDATFEVQSQKFEGGPIGETYELGHGRARVRGGVRQRAVDARIRRLGDIVRGLDVC